MLGAALLIFAMNEVGFRLGRGKGPGLEQPGSVGRRSGRGLYRAGAVARLLLLARARTLRLASCRTRSRSGRNWNHIYPRQIAGRARCRGHPRRLKMVRLAANRVCSSRRQSRTARDRRRKVVGASTRDVGDRRRRGAPRPAVDDRSALHQRAQQYDQSQHRRGRSAGGAHPGHRHHRHTADRIYRCGHDGLRLRASGKARPGF